MYDILYQIIFWILTEYNVLSHKVKLDFLSQENTWKKNEFKKCELNATDKVYFNLYILYFALELLNDSIH